jgi:uncharacterized protein DUF5615
MTGHRFLLDHDCQRAAVLLPERRVLSLADVGLPENASDQKIVEAAWEYECVIVTANGRDFLERIKRFLGTTKKKDCHDLWGLVVLPNDLASQERLLPRAEKKLRFEGEKVTWPRVWRENLYVRLKRDGAHEVRHLPRCYYCEKTRSK